VLATSQTLKIVLDYLQYWGLSFDVVKDREQLQSYSCAIVEEREVIVRSEIQSGTTVIPDFHALMKADPKIVLLSSFSLHHRMKEHIEQQGWEGMVCAISSPLTPNKMTRAVSHLMRRQAKPGAADHLEENHRSALQFSKMRSSTPSPALPSVNTSLPSSPSPSSPVSSQIPSSLLSALSRTSSTDNGLLDVLLVEDNPVNQTVMKKQFELLKINFAITGNAEDALVIWERCVGGISLILMDVELDGPMTGLEATARIRRREQEEEWKRAQPEFRKSPFIAIMTGRALEEDRREAFASGCDEFLVKPVALDRIRDLVLRLVMKSS